MLILALDTSTSMCSISLIRDGKIISSRQSMENYAHNRLLFSFLEEILQESKLSLADVDLLAVGEGPGSFTGLRIGVSAFKALTYSIKKPLYSISSLEAMAMEFVVSNSLVEGQKVRALIDARQKDAFTALYLYNDGKLKLEGNIEVVLISELGKFKDYDFACGNLEKSLIGNQNYSEDLYPNALGISLVLNSRFDELSPATYELEPTYYKEFKVNKS